MNLSKEIYIGGGKRRFSLLQRVAGVPELCKQINALEEQLEDEGCRNMNTDEHKAGGTVPLFHMGLGIAKYLHATFENVSTCKEYWRNKHTGKEIYITELEQEEGE